MNKLLLAILISLTAVPAWAEDDPMCASEDGMSAINPLEWDWNNSSPWIIAGVSAGGGCRNSMQSSPTLCECPGPFGIPSFGFGWSAFMPAYFSETTRRPGCSHFLGGTKVTSGYERFTGQMSIQADTQGSSGQQFNHHWYSMAWTAMETLMSSCKCSGSSGWALAGMSEINPCAKNSQIAASICSPETSLFSNPLFTYSAIAEAVTLSFNTCNPWFFAPWMLGAHGNAYPFTDFQAMGMTAPAALQLTAEKNILTYYRMMAIPQTIGYSTLCWPHPNTMGMKAEIRQERLWPVAQDAAGIHTGVPDFRWAMNLKMPSISVDLGALVDGSNSSAVSVTGPSQSTPGQEYSIDMIWKGVNCCCRLY